LVEEALSPNFWAAADICIAVVPSSVVPQAASTSVSVLWIPRKKRTIRKHAGPQVYQLSCLKYGTLILKQSHPSPARCVKHGLPVDVVAHHDKARGQLLCLEVLCQRQGGVVLRHCGAEEAEFCEGEIEWHKVAPFGSYLFAFPNHFLSSFSCIWIIQRLLLFLLYHLLSLI